MCRMDVAAFLLSTTFMYSAPLIFTALGGVLSENGGVVNIGLEGMMYFGAFVGATAAYYSGNPWIGFLAAGACGGLLSLLHAIACVTFKANNTISGLAINFIGPGFALFLSRLMFDGATYTLPLGDKKMGMPLKGLFPQGSFWDHLLGTQCYTTYLAFLLVPVVWFLLKKTRLGLRIRSVGEYPKAADTLGIPVAKIQYFVVITGGILAGFGGASLSIAVSSAFNPTIVTGQGFIALSAIVFGKWKPQGALAACLIFGFSTSIGIVLGWSSIQAVFPVPSQILAMLPFIVSLVILAGFVGKSTAPSSAGIPYEKDN